MMEYRGIRYTIRAGIERGQWFVAIHPDEGVEVARNKTLGTREDAELRAPYDKQVAGAKIKAKNKPKAIDRVSWEIYEPRPGRRAFRSG